MIRPDRTERSAEIRQVSKSIQPKLLPESDLVDKHSQMGVPEHEDAENVRTIATTKLTDGRTDRTDRPTDRPSGTDRQTDGP